MGGRTIRLTSAPSRPSPPSRPAPRGLEEPVALLGRLLEELELDLEAADPARILLGNEREGRAVRELPGE